MAVSTKKAREFLERKEREKDSRLDERFALARRDFEAIRRMIVESYRPRRIWQWGSLLDRSRFRDYSDIDVAVEGVDEPERFFRMFGQAEKLTEFPLDLVDINRIEPEFAELIKQKGVLVYERKD
jgi:predicted nucleotidyltransferase